MIRELNRTIAELEGFKYEDFRGNYGLPSLVTRVTDLLFKVRIRDMTPHDVALLIRQDFGRQYLIAPAIDILIADMMFENGRLLISLMNLPCEVWSNAPELKLRFAELV